MENKTPVKKTAVILCGGKGTRLGALGKKVPKTLVKVQNKEILWYILNHLKKNGFTDIILPLGYKGDQIKLFLKKNNNFGLNIKAINTGVKINIGKRLYLISEKIVSDNFLLINGDAIFRLDLKKIYEDHCKKKFGVTFLCGEVTYSYGSIGVRNNKIVDFKRNLIFESLKVRNNKKYNAFNYTGMAVIKTDLLKKFREFFKNSKNFEQEFYPKVIKRYKTKLMKIKGFTHSIDNIKDLDVVNIKNVQYEKFKNIKNLKIFFKKNLFNY
tara:strand:- start:4853 stop:5659 length:807 start_codon:yes stop_codon:yes gene_type:complete